MNAAVASGQTVCRFTTAGSLGFGAYDAMSNTAGTSQASILVRCDRSTGSANVTVTIGLGPGSNSASTSARKLVAPGSPTPLSYGLYRDSGRTMNWGNTAGMDTQSQTVNVPNKSFATLTFPVYGSIPPHQDVYTGIYSDSVQVTLTP
ncbi:Csu type fimbrial protein [Ramlibacter sp. MMS24-I3-19]|uniref:Csu type fimbrial protein n=1 Tax=Ramlibacter sp. MMS24-I3-19 TaxID=3416606 RepID=UPI003CFBDEE1